MYSSLACFSVIILVILLCVCVYMYTLQWLICEFWWFVFIVYAYVCRHNYISYLEFIWLHVFFLYGLHSLISLIIKCGQAGMMTKSRLSASGSAASEGLPDTIPLTSAGKSTPASFSSCITVSSGKCVQLLLKFTPRRAGASAGRACTTNYVLVANGAISCTLHLRTSQIRRTEDCCSTRRCILPWGRGGGRGTGGGPVYRDTPQCYCCCHDSSHL